MVNNMYYMMYVYNADGSMDIIDLSCISIEKMIQYASDHQIVTVEYQTIEL